MTTRRDELDCFEKASRLWHFKDATEGMRNSIVWWKQKDRPLMVKPLVEQLLSRLKQAWEQDFITAEEYPNLVETVRRIDYSLDRNDLGDAIIATNTLDDMVMDVTLKAILRCECPKRRA